MDLIETVWSVLEQGGWDKSDLEELKLAVEYELDLIPSTNVFAPQLLSVMAALESELK